ncbi:hypothetical protein GOB57_08535 [Sinorhizobium meliloti]|nr:hypothetical protein [Sinorhizobium meliloti]
MAEEHRYVLMLDKERDFIRVFRSDSPMRPAGKVLWEGNGLHKTYAAMVRLNTERRPVPCYYVCCVRNDRGQAAYRVFKSSHPKVWERVSMHTVYREAVEGAKRLRRLEKTRIGEERRDKDSARAAARAENELLLARLRRAGVVRKRVPKLTAKDLRYLEWLESRRELIEDAA